jgi:hypothetical protein
MAYAVVLHSNAPQELLGLMTEYLHESQGGARYFFCLSFDQSGYLAEFDAVKSKADKPYLPDDMRAMLPAPWPDRRPEQGQRK